MIEYTVFNTVPQVIEYSPRVKMIEWILLTLIASAKGEFKSDGGLALLHSSYLFKLKHNRAKMSLTVKWAE